MYGDLSDRRNLCQPSDSLPEAVRNNEKKKGGSRRDSSLPLSRLLYLAPLLFEQLRGGFIQYQIPLSSRHLLSPHPVEQ